MKVFISWSGDRSRQLAEAIHWWLPNVMQFTKPYFTPSDIEKGARWDNEISKELGQSSICLIAMTEENLTSPWIMFEAGAISRVVEDKARVCPIVFGIKKTDLVGPLASFQATAFDREEVRQLLTTINNAAKDAALTEQRLNAAFDVWWDKLEERVEAISSAAQPPTGPQRSERELLEEAVSNTRTLLRGLQPGQTTDAFSVGSPEFGRPPLTLTYPSSS
jgi:TIR domain